MFKDSPIHGDAEREIQNILMEQDLATPSEAERVSTQWATVFHEFGLSATESRAMADAGLTREILAGAEGRRQRT